MSQTNGNAARQLPHAAVQIGDDGPVVRPVSEQSDPSHLEPGVIPHRRAGAVQALGPVGRLRRQLVQRPEPEVVEVVVRLEDDVPGGYFFLLYAALQEAFEQNVRLVRFGSGAYDVKRMLGLHLEDTNHAMATIASTTTRPAAKVKSPAQSTK